MKANEAKELIEHALVGASEKRLEKTPKVEMESGEDVRVGRSIGEVHSGGNERHDSPVQPDPDTEHGAQDARERKPSSDVTEGHHVHAGGDPGGNRVDYVKSEYSRNESKVRGDSARKTLKEMVATAKGI